MIAKLEWTQSNAQQNIERLQNPIIGPQWVQLLLEGGPYRPL